MSENKTAIIDHRGAAREAPENTLEAFQQAIDKGVPFVELDIRLSKDGIPIVIHDGSLSRFWSKNALVKDLTLEEIKKITGKRRAFKGLKIPSLQEALELTYNKIGVMIEIKVDEDETRYAQLTKQILAVVEPFLKNLIKPIYLGCFYPEVLLQIKKRAPHAKIIYIVERVEYLHYIDVLSPDLLAISYRILSKDVVKLANEKCLPLWVWTVNSKRQVKKCLKLGVDGIISDRPTALGLLKS